MKKQFIIFLAIIIFAGLIPADQSQAEELANRLKGRILLQVESHGEAWYVRSKDLKRYYMKDGSAAYSIMRFFSLGIADVDLAKIPQVSNTDEMKASSSACANSSLGKRFRGEILLQVQQHGEAWYVDPVKCRAIYMKDGAVAYEVMRFLGFGVFTRDLEKIQDGDAVVGSDSNTTSSPTPATSNISCTSPTDTAHMDIFDSHAHMSPTVDAPRMISEMNKAGVSMTNLYSDASHTLEAISQYPGRFITFVETPESTGPSNWLTQGQAFVTSAEAQLKTGKYYGIGETNLRLSDKNGNVATPDVYVVPDTPLWLQLVDLSARYHVPISFHFVPEDATANAAFERMLNHNKDATLIWAHLGFNSMALNSATLNDYLLRYPHLYFDTAGIQNMQRPMPLDGSNWARLADQSNNGKLRAEWQKFFETWNSRILFGTDAGGGGDSLERWLNYSSDTADGTAPDAIGHWKSLFSYTDPNTARNIFSANSRELFLKEQKKPYTYSVASNGKCYSISVSSESSVSALTFNPSTRAITFTVAGSNGTTGNAVITIPKTLITGNIAASVDGQSLKSQLTSNAANTTISLEYSGGIKTITLSAPSTP